MDTKLEITEIPVHFVTITFTLREKIKTKKIERWACSLAGEVHFLRINKNRHKDICIENTMDIITGILRR